MARNRWTTDKSSSPDLMSLTTKSGMTPRSARFLHVFGFGSLAYPKRGPPPRACSSPATTWLCTVHPPSTDATANDSLVRSSTWSAHPSHLGVPSTSSDKRVCLAKGLKHERCRRSQPPTRASGYRRGSAPRVAVFWAQVQPQSDRCLRWPLLSACYTTSRARARSCCARSRRACLI